MLLQIIRIYGDIGVIICNSSINNSYISFAIFESKVIVRYIVNIVGTSDTG